MELKAWKTKGTTEENDDQNLNFEHLKYGLTKQVFFIILRFNQSSKKILDTISSYEKFYIGAI
jgi:hypothetical protein